MSLDSCLEPVGDVDTLRRPRQVWNEEAELVTAKTGMEIARLAASFERQEILGADLIRKNAGDALDDAITNGVAEGVVVPLEAADIDDADAAPADALLDGE